PPNEPPPRPKDPRGAPGPSAGRAPEPALSRARPNEAPPRPKDPPGAPGPRPRRAPEPALPRDPPNEPPSRPKEPSAVPGPRTPPGPRAPGPADHPNPRCPGVLRMGRRPGRTERRHPVARAIRRNRRPATSRIGGHLLRRKHRDPDRPGPADQPMRRTRRLSS